MPSKSLSSAARPFLIMLLCLLAPGIVWASVETSIQITEAAYSRPLPPGQSTAVVYLTLRNAGDKTINFLSVKSPLAKKAEFHRHIHEDGMMKMRQLPSLSVDPGKNLQFEPGGYHIMLFGVKQALRVGDRFAMAIETDNGEELQLDVMVKAY